MNRCIRLFVFTGVFLLVLGLPGFSQDRTAQVQSMTGKVEMQLSATSPWTEVSPGTTIPLGATISTGFRSTAVLQVGPAVLEVQALTRMRLDELVQREGLLQTELFLPVGRIKADVQSEQGLQQEFRLRSPVATAAVRGTSFEFDGQNLTVITGQVFVTNNQGQGTSVSQGESTSVPEDDAPPTPQEQAEQAVQVAVSTGIDSVENVLSEILTVVRSGSLAIEVILDDNILPVLGNQ